MQFRVGLDMNHFQSLHLKITPVPEIQSPWSLEEIQVISCFLKYYINRLGFVE